MQDVGNFAGATDLLSSNRVSINTCDVWACGIECDSISGLNNKAQIGQSLCETAKGRTGRTASACISYVKSAKPRVVILENVRNLGARPAASSSSTTLINMSDSYVFGVCVLVALAFAIVFGAFAFWLRLRSVHV